MAKKRWDKTTRQITMRLRTKQDAAVLERLDSVPCKTEYMRSLILRDIAEGSDE